MDFLKLESWTPYAAGIGIGILSWFTFVLSDKPLGCSTAFARTSGMFARLFKGKSALQNPYYQTFKPEIDWEWMLVLGIVIGSFLSASLSGSFRWQWLPSLWSGTFGTDPWIRIAIAFLGGIFMGFGSRWAGGCTSGHGISGTMQLTVNSWIAVVFFFVGGIGTALLIYRVIGG